MTVQWTRTNYPSEGDAIWHEHAPNVGHRHVGGQRPHGHRHMARRADGVAEYIDEYYETEDEQNGA